eukprot:CAMPEP_0168406704 /NCGR_PEP_ID=MMETSP0228-20121227/25788_1 /TAXON_ID=133427 /ORGANISM="Protoceratium reticulatum, Strain CCCM 535 (=CCMP 1889)" /LENGTH=121 /DNA_ID=CAMNT_0008420359 /DNA_START=155 /DNA_END=517 /DNA_ORIENTATION=+
MDAATGTATAGMHDGTSRAASRRKSNESRSRSRSQGAKATTAGSLTSSSGCTSSTGATGAAARASLEQAEEDAKRTAVQAHAVTASNRFHQLSSDDDSDRDSEASQDAPPSTAPCGRRVVG